MKFLCVVLLVTSIIALSTALAQPATVVPSPICQADWHCQPGCFCYKEGERQQRGQCVCTMDLKVLNECTEDRDCVERDTLRVHHYCGCHRDSISQPTGRCECINPVG